MKKIFLYSLFIIGQFFLLSCESLVKEIDPSILPETDSKLVVACFISPQDTILAAKVTETKVLIGTTGDVRDDITNASVSLSDGSKTIQLIYNAKLGYYRALPTALPISVGKTYTITVSTPDGRKVNASTTVPNNIPIKEVKIDSTAVNDFQRGNTVTNTEYDVKVIWQDKAGENNYYRAISEFIITYGIPDPKNGKNIIYTPISTIVDLRTIDDKDTDGQLLSLNRNYLPTNIGANIQGQQLDLSKRLDKIRVGLFQTDIHYYNYHTSLRRQRENNNPFAEPVLLYTNINGGFGCFGAYNATWQEFNAK
ncbi:DUF4249 domain-containing protein [Emticicia aquatilis]|nr:DUF4249 domain-containing protein [Emticicia aquatilis]